MKQYESQHLGTEQGRIPLVPAFTTFTEDGKPAPVNYLVDRLLPVGSLSLLAAKPKHGKSTLSRYLATCVASGHEFLGRATKRAEVILVSLEDGRQHVDNSLSALGHEPGADAGILLMERVHPTLDDTLSELRAHLAERPDVSLIVLDTIAKVLCVRDLNDYSQVSAAAAKLADFARSTGVHILGLAHAKKTAQADVFDAVLGSTALRAATDTNIAIYQENGSRVLMAETRSGKPVDATVIEADFVEVCGSECVSDFRLGGALSDLEANDRQQSAQRSERQHKLDILIYLDGSESRTATQQQVLSGVTGKTATIHAAIKALVQEGVLTSEGRPATLTIQLEQTALELYKLGLGTGLGRSA